MKLNLWQKMRVIDTSSVVNLIVNNTQISDLDFMWFQFIRISPAENWITNDHTD